ncbi:hypothetical protein [Vibrio phage LP.2]|nr:hypothetical protein [Vibrio phage LP.2]
MAKYEKVIVRWQCDQCGEEATESKHEFTSRMRQSQGECFPDTAKITISNDVMYAGEQDLCIDCQVKLVDQWLSSHGYTVTNNGE